MDNINEIASEAAQAGAGNELVSHFAFELENSNEGVREIPHGPISVSVATRTFTDEEFGYATFQMLFGDTDEELLFPQPNMMMHDDDDRSQSLNTPEPAPTAPNTPINFPDMDADMDLPVIPEEDMDPLPLDHGHGGGANDPFMGMNDGPDFFFFTIAQISRYM
ncbi:uncharacterized protein LOC108164981 [Drosophila miranda]|uniref:uncharacterized protein LOC108164981 n=1 Tax=Drosophila miranda TaxID=7229 RepID=UPI0007E6695B|nr:uncharacterized protein LOC108164981 [Drosophila miranda]